MRIRLEISNLATRSISGVGNYTRLLGEALDANLETPLQTVYFNFLNRQKTPVIEVRETPRKNSLVPLRIYAKLQSYGMAPPFDFFLPKADLTIFPNFATWPTLRSRLRATVIHDLTYLRHPEVVEAKNLQHLRRVVSRSVRRADFIITVSETIKQELVDEFGLDPSRCVVTTIPPDASFSVPNPNEIHQKYGIPTKEFIFFIGNLEPRKDLPTLIDAYRQLPDALRQRYSLVLAGGKGWKTERSERAIADAQAANEQIVHVGYIDQADASAFHQQASLFVMSSLYEGFGMPILEALTSRTPVVASDIPVLREAGGAAALYAEPKNSHDFAAKITDVLTSQATQIALRSAAIPHLATFSWDQNTKHIVDTARRLLNRD